MIFSRHQIASLLGNIHAHATLFVMCANNESKPSRVDGILRSTTKVGKGIIEGIVIFETRQYFYIESPFEKSSFAKLNLHVCMS